MKKKKERARDEKWNWKKTIYRSEICIRAACRTICSSSLSTSCHHRVFFPRFFYKRNTRREIVDNPTEVISLLQEVTTQSGLPPSQLSKAISRISTEYRLQFAWPRRPQLTNGETVAPGVMAAGLPAGTTGPPRKSLSMGALKQGIAPTGPAPVHKKRPGDVDHKRDGKWNISTNL